MKEPLLEKTDTEYKQLNRYMEIIVHFIFEQYAMNKTIEMNNITHEY